MCVHFPLHPSVCLFGNAIAQVKLKLKPRSKLSPPLTPAVVFSVTETLAWAVLVVMTRFVLSYFSTWGYVAPAACCPGYKEPCEAIQSTFITVIDIAARINIYSFTSFTAYKTYKAENLEICVFFNCKVLKIIRYAQLQRSASTTFT
jgi:hypothetical protein